MSQAKCVRVVSYEDLASICLRRLSLLPVDEVVIKNVVHTGIKSYAFSTIKKKKINGWVTYEL